MKKGWQSYATDFLQGVNAAELVEFVVDLVVDQSFIVVGGVVLHNLVD